MEGVRGALSDRNDLNTKRSSRRMAGEPLRGGIRSVERLAERKCPRAPGWEMGECRTPTFPALSPHQRAAHSAQSTANRTDSSGRHLQCVRRRLQISELPARELVPGDIVELHAGDRVPADLRILTLRTATVRAEQASLTGKS